MSGSGSNKPLCGYTAAVYTLGCKVNACESEQMEKALLEAGCRLVSFEEPADFYILNTCTVTQTAQKKSRQMLHRARNQQPDARVIACGCFVDALKMPHSGTCTEKSARKPSSQDTAPSGNPVPQNGADLFLSNKEKDHLVDYLVKLIASDPGRGNLSKARFPETASSDSPSKGPGSTGTGSPVFQGVTGSFFRTRADLKIQDGCRQFCTYCLIPYVRGGLSSVPPREVVRQAHVLASRGCREIVLTGIHLSSYGLDTAGIAYNDEQGPSAAGQALLGLLQELDGVPGIERIRLGSLEPRLITEEFVQGLSTITALCPHFHLALQSGCDRILCRMNRRYSCAEFEKAVQRLRSTFPLCAVTTDIMVGFPGETGEDHLASLVFVRRMGFAEAHIFRFSPMQGTAAYRMDHQVPAEVKKQRAREMLDVTAASTKTFLERMQGTFSSVLLEERDEASGCWIGCCPNYMKAGVAAVPRMRLERGALVSVRIDGYLPYLSANHDASGVPYILKGYPENVS